MSVRMSGICEINTSLHAATGNNASVAPGVSLLTASLVPFFSYSEIFVENCGF